ncbi:hypothetical protein AVEN_101853-1 [Araneus ventricosus]|uniref:Uncharacterized protein n=1 Tax=Araneus ventricosus TaxID=182803 RepID=A0A4Y2D9R4_ARAVE|nr:hypothetical protein AVEN_101853-1 [Araneus ventricosus]
MGEIGSPVLLPQSCPVRLFSALKSALSGHHFRSNEDMQRAEKKNFLRSLGHRFLPGRFLEIDFMVRQRYQCRWQIYGKIAKSSYFIMPLYSEEPEKLVQECVCK